MPQTKILDLPLTAIVLSDAACMWPIHDYTTSHWRPNKLPVGLHTGGYAVYIVVSIAARRTR